MCVLEVTVTPFVPGPRSFVHARTLLRLALTTGLAKVLCIALVLTMVRRAASTAALQTRALRAVVTKLRARLSLAWVAVTRVNVRARGAGDCVRGGGGCSGLGVAGRDCVGGLAWRLGDGVGGEGV